MAKQLVAGCIGGELSKRQGVLFHWRSLSSKRNEKLLAVLPRYKVYMNFKHHILVTSEAEGRASFR